MEDYKEFRVTNPILVKLTEEGMKAYRENIASRLLNDVTEQELDDYIGVNTIEGYLKMPLYIFSNLFGPTMIDTSLPPHFKCDILIHDAFLTSTI